MPMRWCLAAFGILLLVTLGSAAPVGEQHEVDDPRVKAAIDRAVKYLGTQPGFSSGERILGAVALLKAGQPADHPKVKQMLEQIQSRVVGGVYTPADSHIYGSCVSIMALGTADPVLYKPEMQAITDYVIKHQSKDGCWTYLNQTVGDTSISQYGVLALWEATRAGIDVPKDAWNRAALWLTRTELNDGGFGYHPAESNPSTHTMTAAAVGSLYVIRLHLYPNSRELVTEAPKAVKKRGIKYGVLYPIDPETDEMKKTGPAAPKKAEPAVPTVPLTEIDKAIIGGKKWLSERWTIEPNLSHKKYYLYAIERMMALGNITDFDGHDWYKEGTELLLREQDGNGGWVDGSGTSAGTSFGILFLGRATAKALNRPWIRRTPKLAGGLLAGGRGLPTNLSQVLLENGGVKVRKLKGTIDELLAELEKSDGANVESAQAAIVDQVMLENPQALIAQKERLKKLVLDKRIEVRRTAYWALGRTDDLLMAPLLIAGLSDADPGCFVEARNGLRFLSHRLVDDTPDTPTDAQRAAAITRWKTWYLAVRPYSVRDDLP